MNIPDNLYYTNNHEWVKIDNGIATIGITDYAQSELGDIIFIEFPDIGVNCNAGDSLGTIEAVKTVTDYYSPIEGRIAEINNKLEENPDSVNTDPYDSGWIIKLDSFGEDRSALLSAKEYEKLVG
jgi:glycine cleavage system H protein